MTLSAKGVVFSYGKKRVLDGISVSIEKGEIYTLLGGSGSGKTTFMNILAGFLDPLSGTVTLDGKDLLSIPPEKRGAGMVFQDYALFPHLNVLKNISFPMKVRGKSSSVIRRRADGILKRVGLQGFQQRMPSALSGGEKQRVALARTLSSDPSFLLLDEPLSALDASLRDELRRELRSILKEAAIPTLYVTHDQVEAMAISDKIGLMHAGSVIEEGTPEDLYWRPKRTRTASFMGFTNIFPVRDSGKGELVLDIGRIPWDSEVPDRIAFRPLSAMEEGDDLPISGRVVSREYRGRDQLLDIYNGKDLIRILASPDQRCARGCQVKSGIPIDRIIPLWD